MGYIPRLKQEYKDRVVSALTEEFGYKNVMQVPKLQKVKQLELGLKWKTVRK